MADIRRIRRNKQENKINKNGNKKNDDGEEDSTR